MYVVSMCVCIQELQSKRADNIIIPISSLSLPATWTRLTLGRMYCMLPKANDWYVKALLDLEFILISPLCVYVCWYIKAGDLVLAGQDLCTLEWGTFRNLIPYS